MESTSVETPRSDFRVAVFDIETNGLRYEVSRFHCACIIDAFTGERFIFTPTEGKDLVEKLLEFDAIVGHNIAGYDIPALEKLFGISFKGKQICDTLVISQTYDPVRQGGHSLKAWGKRLGLLKGDYGDEPDAWEEFSEEMLEYCVRDVEVSVKLFHHLSHNEIGNYVYSNY